MSSILALSDYLNLMFTATHLAEMIRIGQSAQIRLSQLPNKPAEDFQNPSQLWFIQPRYLARFVALGQQAQAEQDANRSISLEAAVQALTPKRRKITARRNSDNLLAPPMAFKPFSSNKTVTQPYSNKGNVARLENRECVAIEVVIWVIDHLQHLEGSFNEYNRSDDVRGYGGGYFEDDSTPTNEAYGNQKLGRRDDYAIMRGPHGDLVLGQM
ncbi:hypothetical protein EJ02DRAFT_492947 [Clathrospora elynae]|uniref:Uncharacterized protein n=1 Tax=Clathrospora elynae TaxID=706981 RepID=A0A6A5SN62_9PLEO|nr:hypothetical protein EJ02DRAFT_492947 [Clathrospora elynae]